MSDIVEKCQDNPYRIEVRVRNNLILRRIKECGFQSISAFCQKFDIGIGEVGNLINFKKLPIKENGEWRDAVFDISSALHCEPEDLFTERQKTLIARRRHTIEMTEVEFIDSYESGKLQNQLEAQDLIKKISTNLTPRERQVIQKRFYENMHLHEVGEEILNITSGNKGVTRERVREIEHKALRKMRRKLAQLEINQSLKDELIAEA